MLAFVLGPIQAFNPHLLVPAFYTKIGAQVTAIISQKALSELSTEASLVLNTPKQRLCHVYALALSCPLPLFEFSVVAFLLCHVFLQAPFLNVLADDPGHKCLVFL
ncbi:hypothetical protein SETIT_9G249800v2 [Setaria italica]|uniref:Uncharacterized protein n=1 Tax=Setaria italica TaxID=4555 RepID=A0A368SK97_SETIT|nr:hypothetical protein SETIT_9G249800v2 [Setaria italica]RCV42868.1 hypothetical protein SETIT_9G249800v2 [Setaria italica]RCV42869.1 hypothetical protein SETIT_9G249800v2 [Setaria italica]